MFVIGGAGTGTMDNKEKCLPNQPIEIFDLSALEFVKSYHPEDQGSYRIPKAISNVIGGE